MGRACHGPSQMDAASLVSGGFATLRIDRFRLHRGFYARSPTHHLLHSATPTCPALADSPVPSSSVPLPRHAYPTPWSSWLLCCAPFPRVVVSWAVSDGCGISRQRRRRDAFASTGCGFIEVSTRAHLRITIFVPSSHAFSTTSSHAL